MFKFGVTILVKIAQKQGQLQRSKFLQIMKKCSSKHLIILSVTLILSCKLAQFIQQLNILAPRPFLVLHLNFQQIN